VGYVVGSAGGDNRNVDRRGDRLDEFEVVAGPCSVPIPAREQDLAGTTIGSGANPALGISARASPTPVDDDFPTAASPARRIDGEDRAL